MKCFDNLLLVKYPQAILNYYFATCGCSGGTGQEKFLI